MSKKEIAFKIQCYKQGDAAPHYETYQVECDKRTTVLEALQDIRRDHAPSLMLRHSCHHASCGTCGMRINGQEQLACVANVLDLGTSTVTVEPLNNIPLVSDLVVDMDAFFAKYNASGMPYIRLSEFNPEAETPGEIEAYTRYENCIECGICVSACPVAGSDLAYLGPAAMAAGWRVIEEPRGHDPASVLTWVDNEHGCWRCHVAFECSEACPSDVDPGGAIMALRRELTRQKIRRFFGLGK
jgi:succinate dehydrogenase / fumarate reductase iron-sulfur subunit